MKERLEEFVEWMLKNPILVIVIVSTALGVTNIVFESSKEGVKFELDIDKD